MMVRVGAALDTVSYDKTVAVVLGNRSLHAFQVMLVVAKMGSLLSNSIFIADFCVVVAETALGQRVNRIAGLLVVVCGISLPLALMRKVSSLRFTGNVHAQ